MATHGARFELSGFLRPLKTAEEDEEDTDTEDDDDIDFEFPDEFGAERGQIPRRQAVEIQTEKSQENYKVVGRFPFLDPWWKVNVKVKLVGSKYYAQGCPSYFLQTDAGENQKAIISLFFKACEVPEEFRNTFFEWLPEGSPLSFTYLEELVCQFQESKQTTTNNVDIFHYIKRSCTGKAVLLALVYPDILKILPKLLPRYIFDCIEWMDRSQMQSQARLRKLSTILMEEPWKLGFSIIMYRELHISFVEVPWTTFDKCRHLLKEIPDLQKNALIVYAKLKDRCRTMGHTYEKQEKLTSMVSKVMAVEHAWQSLAFMKEEDIVVTEGEYVFLSKLYKAEKTIAHTIRELVKKPPWQLYADAKKVLNGGARMNFSTDPVVESKTSDEELCGMNQKEPSNTSDMQENYNNSFDYEEQTPKKEIKIEVVVDPDQASAIQLICDNPVTIISGKGGCGKTTVVSFLFRYLKDMEIKTEVENACKDFEADVSYEDNTCFQDFNENKRRNNFLNILFTAPTGRAAGLLQKKTQLPACTLHQVIWGYYSWKNSCPSMEERSQKPWKHSKVNILVVDEGSLVSVELLSRVLQLLLYHACLAKLIILGDVRQLPSINPGNMLADVFESLKSRGWALELRTNHRTESQLIIENATRISQRMFPEFDEVLRISAENNTWPMPSPEKKFIWVVLPPEDGSNYLLCAIKALLERGPGLKDAKQSQFISFRRQDCDIINELCCMHYSGHPMRNHKNRLQFMCGDKACSTRNAYFKQLLPDDDDDVCTKNDENSNDSGPCSCNVCLRRKARTSGPHLRSEKEKKVVDYYVDDRRLCNGEIFFIIKDTEVDKTRLLTISIPDGEEYTLDYRALKKICRMKHAWARTIHTFQGSEEDTIVYVVGNSCIQNWQHVYTAVTRGRCRVYIVAETAMLHTAIDTKCFNRKTHLRKHLKDALMGKMDDFEQMSVPHRSGDFASHAGNNSINKEEPTVADEMKEDFGPGITVELAATVEEPSPHPNERKRQSELPNDCSSPAKVALTTEEKSPLGTNKLQKMTLKSPVSKQLFQS